MITLGHFMYYQLFTKLPKPTKSIKGQTVIVTGSNVGLGKEAARSFTQLGASTVILAVRSPAKGEAAKAEIEKSTGTSGVVQVWQLDMSSYQSVLNFAARAAKELERLDIAVLNAGVARGTWETFEQDESTITVNVVSTFLLALALLPKMKETAGQFNTRPNLSILSSEMHYWAKYVEGKNVPRGNVFKNLNKKPAKVNEAFLTERYTTSKLLDLMGVRAMAERKNASQIPVTFNSLTPGLCHSELSRESGFAFTVMKFLLARTTEVGARALVHAGLAGPETHGEFLMNAKIFKPSDFVLSAEGHEAQNAFWDELEEKLEGIKQGITKVLY